MNKFTLTHEFDCTPEVFWSKVNFDKEMNERMYKTALQFPEFTLLELTETDSEIFRRTRSTPKVDLPGPVQKLLGSNFQFTEETRYDKRSGRAVFKGIPSTMADKMKTDGTMRVEALGASRCRRVIEVTVEAKVMMVGGLLESTAEKNMRDSYDKSAVFMNQWIKEKGFDKA